MKGLILKDLMNISKYKKTLIVNMIFLIGLSIFVPSMLTMLPVMMTAYILMIGLSTFNFDEVSKSEKYILAMPLDKKEIVRAKYILMNFLMVVSFLITFTLTVILSIILKSKIEILNILISSISGILVIALMFAIQIPVIYKLGYEKGRISGMLYSGVIIVALIGIFIGILKISIVTSNINNVVIFLEKFGVIFAIFIYALITYISYKISCKVYSKRDI